MIDICVEMNYLTTCLNAINLLQMIIQGCWLDCEPLLLLPHFGLGHIKALRCKFFQFFFCHLFC